MTTAILLKSNTRNLTRALLGAKRSEQLFEEYRYLKRGLASEPGIYMRCMAYRAFGRKVRHTLQITSFGGVGTTFLYRMAEGNGMNIYRPYDGGPWRFDYGVYKHMRRPLPRERVRDGYRVLYVVGDPRSAVLSLFRRGFHAFAMQRLQTSPGIRTRFNPDWSLSEYLDHREDMFELSGHVRNWLENPDVAYPVATARYRDLPATSSKVRDFLGLPQSAQFDFQPRLSDIAQLSQRDRENMDHIYGALAEYINDLPPFKNVV